MNGYYRIGATSPQDSLPRTFDKDFATYSEGVIPLTYLRALVKRENSKFDPTVNSLGLMQITPIARRDWNRRHPDAPVTNAELQDPSVNIALGVELLRNTIEAYQSTGVPNLQMNWDNPEFIKLLTAGWNSGPNGIRRTAVKLHNEGKEATHAAVMRRWRQTNSNLASTAKERWQAGVASLYFRTRGDGEAGTEGRSEPKPEPLEVPGEIVVIEDTGEVFEVEPSREPLSNAGKYGLAALFAGGLIWALTRLLGD